jgi:cardiolipin synthase (CMP-forming)
MTLPNFITIARIFMVPAIVWLLFNKAYGAAFVLFVLAGLSDALDGFVAKQFGLRSELGAYLDPLADKVMLVAIYVVLGIFEHLPIWLVIAVVSRDVAIVGAVMLSWLLERPVEMVPHIVSKANTVMQIILVGLVLADLAYLVVPDYLLVVAMALTGLLTALSIAVYLREWLQHMNHANGSGTAPGDRKPDQGN